MDINKVLNELYDIEELNEKELYAVAVNASRIIKHLQAELTQLKAEKSGEWVSVADRLPTFLQYEDSEPVEYLVMLKYANVPTTLYFDGKQWFDFDWNCWKRVDNEYEVTHWQPLPQTPKDGD